MNTIKRLIATVLCVFLMAGTALVEDGLKITFLNVGQGDCALLQCDGEAMLIDTGIAGAWQHIRDVLDKKKVEELKYLVITHPHADHIGAAPDVFDTFAVSEMLLPPIESATIAYDKMITVAQEKGITLVYPDLGDVYTLGGATLTVYGPNPVAYSNANNWSVVLMVQYGEHSALFTGDAEFAAEMDMLANNNALPLKADVLKVAHHGSETSSNYGFLAEVRPDIAVVSCGDMDKYPSTDVAMTLMDVGVTKLMTTKAHGDIEVVFLDEIDIKTEY